MVPGRFREARERHDAQPGEQIDHPRDGRRLDLASTFIVPALQRVLDLQLQLR